MQLDIKKAILVPFSERRWLLVLLILSVLRFCYKINNNLPFRMVLIFGAILFLGYFCQFVHNEFNNISPSLPSWKSNFIKYLRQGFICSIGMFINLLIFSCFIIPFFALTQVIHNNNVKYVYDLMHQLSEIIMIYVSFIVPCLYAENFKLRTVFNFKKLFKMIFNTKFDFLLCFIILIISGKIISLISLHIKPIYMQIILTSLIFSIVYVVVFDLFIQTFKLHKQKSIDLEIIDSGSLESLEIEKELSKWNWGAFFFPAIWGIFNRSYWTLLVFLPIPYFEYFWAIICAIKGNEWAWRNKKWESVEQFQVIQKKWALYGAIFCGVVLIGMLAYKAGGNL